MPPKYGFGVKGWKWNRYSYLVRDLVIIESRHFKRTAVEIKDNGSMYTSWRDQLAPIHNAHSVDWMRVGANTKGPKVSNVFRVN